MDNLNIDQLRQIPWNKKYIQGSEVPPEPDPEDIPGIIKVPFMKRDAQYSLFYTWLEIVRLVRDEKPLKILDAACGRGQIAQILYSYGHNVVGTDVVDAFCADNKIPFIQADLDYAFPFPDQSFDIVINSTALHYMKSSEHFFIEAKRVLKDNGKLIFTYPNISSLAGRYYFFKTGKISEFSSAILSRKNFLYPDYIHELLLSLAFQSKSKRGVVPIINNRIRLFNMIFGKWMFGHMENEYKYSPTIVWEVIKS